MPAQSVSCEFRAEHSVMRQTLATLTAVMRAGQWREGGPALERLAELLEFQELFDDVCHRPKRDALLRALSRRHSGLRGPAADEREEGVHLVLQTLGLVGAVQRQEPGSDAALERLLEELQARVLMRLEWEDAELLPQAQRTLREQDWSRLQQEFEATPFPAAALYQRDRAAGPARRHPESPARFEESGFLLDGQLDFARVPRFRPPVALAHPQAAARDSGA